MGKDQEPAPLDDSTILKKAQGGGALSQEEEEHIAGNPNTEAAPDADPEESDEEIEGEDESPDDEGDEKPDGGSKKKVKKEDDAEEEATEDADEDDDAEPEEAAGEEDEDDDDTEDTEDPPQAKTKPTKEETDKRRKQIEGELDKPEHLVDLSKYTSVEIGLYWELRKERRKRQKAENDARTLQFQETQRKLKDDAEPEEVEDPFKDMDDDDFVSVKEVREASKKSKKPVKTKETTTPILTTDQVRVQNVEADARLRGKGIDDFFDVINHAGEVFQGDLDIAEELRETAKAGGNVSEKAYWILKGHAKWPDIQKRIEAETGRKVSPTGKKPVKVDPDNVNRAKRIDNNAKKIKTTGKSGGGAVETGQYSVEEIVRMTPAQFGRLPKKTQDSILLKYGSEPNYSV